MHALAAGSGVAPGARPHYNQPLMDTATPTEREIKLRFDSVDQAREAVLAAGGTPLHCRRLQEDSLLDTEDESLRRRRCVLRIRVENGAVRLEEGLWDRADERLFEAIITISPAFMGEHWVHMLYNILYRRLISLSF